MCNTVKITTRMLFKNMDLISRETEKAQNDYLKKEMGLLNFERRRNPTVFVYKPYGTIGYFKVCEYLCEYIAFIRKHDRLLKFYLIS